MLPMHTATATPRTQRIQHPAHAGDDAPTVSELVERAREGCSESWQELFDRFGPMVRSVARRFRLGAHDTDDVVQAVWLLLCERIDDLRDPVALPRWLVVVTGNECRRVIKTGKRTQRLPSEWDEWQTHPAWSGAAGSQDVDDVDSRTLREEGIRVVREGLAELPAHQRELLLLLVADPPLPYAEISDRLGMPIGSIGPTRARVLRKLRQTRPVRSWIAPETAYRLAA